MSRSWVYQYFPQTRELDADRFWDAYTIFDTLSETGFEVRIDINCDLENLRYDEVIAEARNRDMSQLNMIEEDEYRKGLDRLLRDGETRETLPGELAVLSARGVRSAKS